jgi:hypothetical protein
VTSACNIIDIISIIGIIDVIGIIVIIGMIDIICIITITFSAGSRSRSPNSRKYRRIDVDQIDHLRKVLLAEYLLQSGRKSKSSDIITIFSTSVIIDLIGIICIYNTYNQH